MNKVFSSIVFCLCLCFSLKAQVVIINDNVLTQRLSEIKASVVDSLTNEPVAFASVYVVPSKDTVITNFTLTDATGKATLDEVPFGSYAFHVEMMGYKPFVKERYFREAEVDMGTIKLQVDENFLQAATVTDVGNPIVVKKDTVEFNASSFRVGANAMLKDLLQRMPGMEITEDGKVKFNGELIDKLTVGGRTFFFNDQSTALNNLPAAIVDKIRVIDRETEQARATGVSDGEREKVLDVALKKEYEQGWFGNVGVKGGTTVGSKDAPDDLRDDRGLLYSTNALVSAYNEKDQVTVVANGQNIDDSGITVIIVREDDRERLTSDSGLLSSAAQLGVNVNTSRIKDVETTLSANYKYGDMISGAESERTAYQDDGDLLSTAVDKGRQSSHVFRSNLELKKEKGKVWFHVRPEFSYEKMESWKTGSSEVFRAGSFVNNSDNSFHSLSTVKNAGADTDVTFRDLGGKKGRSISLDLSTDYETFSDAEDEATALTTAAGTVSRTMLYNSDGFSSSLSGSVGYTEPLGEKWTLSTTAEFSRSWRESVRDAFDAGGRNDYYSSENRTDYISQRYHLRFQYKFNQYGSITLGGRVNGVLNEVYSKSYGIEDVTGKDEWIWYVTPDVRFQFNKGNNRLNLSAAGGTTRPSASRMLPVLSTADPSRLSLGNIYLKPYSQTTFTGTLNRNNRKKFSTLMVYLYGNLNRSPITYARWYDSDGILYSIPVNARKPSLSASLSGNYTTPLDAKRNWSLTVNTGAGVSSSVSYQTRTRSAGLDKENFDYSAFMDDFWGNADGDRFYAGQSGFGESKTISFSPYLILRIRYNQERWSFSGGARTRGEISRYSLDPSVNMNTLDSEFFLDGTYMSKHGFDFDSHLGYAFYRGYAEGYGQPEWNWDAEISKNVGAFNLSVKIHDILNQTRNLTHTVTANYEEDSYRLIMGRHVLFGVKWNFGKMNAAHSARSQRAALDMAL